jgi:tetratricopeptide (TPR) repeat protein
MTHYDTETLFAFLEGMTPIDAGIEAHVASCDECAQELRGQRALLATLREPRMWAEAPARLSDAARDAAAFAERMAAEDEAAAMLCAEVLAGPSAWWPQRLRNTDGAATAGMVRQLLVRMRPLIERCPKDALQVTGMALALAEELEPGAYPPHSVESLRAQALRDRAYVLAFMSRYAEAGEHADRAQRLFATVPASDCHLARLALVRAVILRGTRRPLEAVRYARAAAETFLAFGERSRYVTARMIEGDALYNSGAVDRALEIWSSLAGDPAVDGLGAVRLAHNIALCQVDLGMPERAIAVLHGCIAEFESRGLRTEAARSRGVCGRALIGAARPADAIPLLRQTARELAELGLVTDFGLAALEIAEALLALDRVEEVPAVCREVIARFTAAGLAAQATTALSYLREAEAAVGERSVRLVRAARASMRALA